jgi:C_GCAxxG_C_C family probable redox protein
VKKDDMMKRSRGRARENHLSGMNCGESTFRAVLETLREEGLTDVPIEVVMLATGLGGGIGSSGNTCCAVIGAALGMSSVHGRKDPFELPTPEARRDQLGGENGRYRLYNNMVHELRGNIGSISCAELTRPFDYYSDERKESCRTIIGEAAALAIKWTIIGIEEGYRHPFRYNIMGKK